MNLCARVLISMLLMVVCFLFAQGRGVLNKVDRTKVLKITSGLTNGMTEAGVTAFLSKRGLEFDMWTINPGEVITFYAFGDSWASFAKLVIVTKPKKEMSFEAWKAQHLTNSFLSRVDVEGTNGRNVSSITFTNSP
jgi:hypothetical protein